MNMEKSTIKGRQPFRDSIELQSSYPQINNQAITSFSKENVHLVTLNTFWLPFLIDHFLQVDIDGYDQKTHLSIRIHIVENEKG